MSMRRLFKASAILGLAFGLLLLAWTGAATADIKPKDIIKNTNTLKTSKDPKAKVAALEDLGKAGQIQQGLITDAIPDMMKALEDKDPTVRAAAAKAVGMIDLEPSQVIPPLVKMMKEDKVEAVKIAAIQGLAAMGPNAKEAVKDMREVAKDKDKKDKVAMAVNNAMKSINPKKK
ncbi:HEAT repeat domain-containing protein [Fimbriiglobus ruber]|uniref:HEAT repeat domain-containing protein n=1 Tax=Fimbriiglobus ruber TaxID=1908690 RepID=A0A225DDY9_9BACT|nr:HEAT repeat domain-containing protein [Fimbriiglobus ruber]OWK39682.1 hypothetical protein FRUB_05572 [Fimbriiglobus ruber]